VDKDEEEDEDGEENEDGEVGEDEDEVGEENEDVEVDEDEDVKLYRHVGYYQVSRVIFCNFLNNGLSNYNFTPNFYILLQ
jgi:hypothetical protein